MKYEHFDRQAYFSEVRKWLFRPLTQIAVNGQNAIIDEWLTRWQERTPLTQFAYVLATPWLETDRTMQPIHEYGNKAYFTKMYDIKGARPNKARELGNIYPGDGPKFPGMGLVQSTGRGNARRNTAKLRAMGIIDNSTDFERTPELMMLPQYAIPILFAGMEEGWFTGKTLDQTIDERIDGDEYQDFLAGRRIINGQDRAAEIATAATHFLKALQAATANG